VKPTRNRRKCAVLLLVAIVVLSNGRLGSCFADPLSDGTVVTVTSTRWVDATAYAGGLAAAAKAPETMGKFLVVSSVQNLTENVTISADRGLYVMPGGCINRAGYTLTVIGSFIGSRGCFQGAGAVVFGKPITASITWFPLQMNGVADDSGRIQEAINSLPAGSTLRFPVDSTHYYTKSAVKAKDGVSLVAEGRATWEIMPSISILNIIDLNGASNLAIRGFRFISKGTKTSKIYALQESRSNNNVLFENLWFNGVSFAIKLDTVNCVNNTIRDIRIEDAGYTATGSGAIFTNGTNTVIDSVYGRNIGKTHLDHLIYPGPHNLHTKISNAHMVDGAGYLVSNGNLSSPTQISNSTIRDSYGGISGRVNAVNVTVENQNVKGGTAFYLQQGSSISNSQVTGHQGIALSVAENCTVDGIRVTSTSTGYGIGVQTAGPTGQKTVISNSVFQGTGIPQMTVATYITVTSAANHMRWVNNSFWNVATGTVISDLSDDSQYVSNYFYSSDGASFHTRCIAASGTRTNILNNQARYLAGVPKSVWDTSGQTDRNASLTYVEGNFSNVLQVPTVAGMPNLRIDSNSYMAYVKGTADVSVINGTVAKQGAVLTLIFLDGAKLKHMAAGPNVYKLVLKSGADVSATKGYTLRLIFTGLYWYQL
jgi:hypothetical protein